MVLEVQGSRFKVQRFQVSGFRFQDEGERMKDEILTTKR